MFYAALVGFTLTWVAFAAVMIEVISPTLR